MALGVSGVCRRVFVLLGAAIATVGCDAEPSSFATGPTSSSDASSGELAPTTAPPAGSTAPESSTTSATEAVAETTPAGDSSEHTVTESTGAAAWVTSEPPSPVSDEASSTTGDTSRSDANTSDGSGVETASDVESADGETNSNICNEVVPEDRHVDGIPAYAQCDASESGGVWSVDGVTTSAAQGGDWRRTQWGGGYQCTEFASRYLYFVWGVTSVPNGNAGAWCDSEPPEGLVQSPAPVHGDLIVFAPGSCGASAETGHVAVIDVVDEAASRVVIVEQNRAGRRTTNVDCAACFLHAVANDAR